MAISKSFSFLSFCLVAVVATVLCVGIFVDSATSTKIEEVQVFQSHSKDFWQINGDDAGTQSGELAFIWLEWDSFPSYHFVTIYNLLVNNTYTEYTPCDEDDGCSQPIKYNRKHAGKVDMGYIAIPESSFTSYLASSPLTAKAAEKRAAKDGALDAVSYYDLTWYSFPRSGACENQNSMGVEGCGFYDKCAVKSIARRCLEDKHGWKKAIDDDDYFSLWPIFVLAFQEDEVANGGCPDMTAGNFTICPNSAELLKKPETYGARPLPAGEKVPRILPSEPTPPSSVYSAYTASPLIGIDVSNNSVCQILDDSTCKPLLSFDPPLSSFATASILSATSAKGIIYFHLHTRPGAGCSEGARVVGYEFESNSWVINFTVSYNLKWFAVDDDDNMLVGVFSNDKDYLRMNLVQISLASPHQDQIITNYAIYNTSNEAAQQIAYDAVSNTIYFPGECPYMSWPTFVSYSLNSATQTAFPIVTLNQTVFAMTFAATSNALYGVVVPPDSETWIGQLDPATGIFFPTTVSMQSTTWDYSYSSLLAYDSSSNAVTFCVKKGDRYQLTTFEMTSQTFVQEIEYPCARAPFQYVVGSSSF